MIQSIGFRGTQGVMCKTSTSSSSSDRTQDNGRPAGLVAGITGAPANESLRPGGEKEEELEGHSRACSPREGANGGDRKRRRWRCSATAGSVQHGLGCSGGPEVEEAGGIRSARRSGARDGVRLPQGRTTATHDDETARRRSFSLQLRWRRRGLCVGVAAVWLWGQGARV
jgi:hypothetical protein